MALNIIDLQAEIVESKKEVLRGVNLEIKPGEIHVLMGPNGSGKSSLCRVLSHDPNYQQVAGEVTLDGQKLDEFEPHEIARLGLFVANQYPVEVPGVNLVNFLRLAYQATNSEEISLYKFRKLLRDKLVRVGLDESFLERNLNENFSGGEKKKCEILQMLVLKPKYAILDETDSGLDVDALKTIFTAISAEAKSENKLGLLIITHYYRIFDYIEPDFVHIFGQGNILESGGIELAAKVQKQGYNI